MVFFVCEACNETLKKNQVDKHCYSCRRCEAVTCVDCQVTFYGDDYKEHVTCVSEAEKYEKSLFKGKKEKANPQDAWVALIAQCAASSAEAPANIRQYLIRLADTSNVPRNKNKFANFIKNSMRLFSDALINSMWDFIQQVKARNDAAEAKTSNTEATQPHLVADASERAAATEEVKKKDKKDTKTKEESEGAALADEDVAEEEEEGKSDKKKRKKDKKRKREAEEAEVAVEPVADETCAEDSEKKHKKAKKEKKEKKSKRDE